MTYFPKLDKNVPMLTAWSYSRFNDYKRCPMFFAYKHLLRIKEEASPAMQRGRDVHKVAEDYLIAPKAPRKVPAELQHFAEEFQQLRTMNPTVEQQWGFTKTWSPADWFGKDVWCRVVLDVVIVYDDDTALVIDHKTGKKYATNEDQMQLFGLSTFKKFPALKEVSTRLWYLDQPNDNEVEFIYKAKEIPAIQRDWEKAVVPMFRDRKFPPRPNEKCKWCFLSKAKGGPCKF